jgi:hypothetical protein
MCLAASREEDKSPVWREARGASSVGLEDFPHTIMERSLTLEFHQDNN